MNFDLKHFFILCKSTGSFVISVVKNGNLKLDFLYKESVK